MLWSETVYPLTFGHPKSEAGAEFDREILDVVTLAKVPFVFGTYDLDDAGEYNAAAFVAPGSVILRSSGDEAGDIIQPALDFDRPDGEFSKSRYRAGRS